MGTAYKLTPQSGKRTEKYTESVMRSFGGAKDGKYPEGGLIVDATGALYGTCSEGGRRAAGGGMAFKLIPTKNGYVEHFVWQFGRSPDGWRPVAGLTMGANGVLYGTTIFGTPYHHGESGAAFSLTPQKRQATEERLWMFGTDAGGYGPNGLTADSSGAVYGTTCCGGAAGHGTVFELAL